MPVTVKKKTVTCPECGFENPYSACFCDSCKEPLGRKFDEDKLQWWIFPFRAAGCIVRVMMFGANKYAVDNWKHVKPPERYLRAAIGHIIDWKEKSEFDEETGFSHLWHSGCCLIFAIWLELEGKLVSPMRKK